MYYTRDLEKPVSYTSSPQNALLPPRWPRPDYPESSTAPFQGDQSEALSVLDPSHSQRRAKVLWSSGLFDCFSDIRNCCITCWCPCITFGQIAEAVDKGIPSCGISGALYALIACGNGCCCLYSCLYRTKMKQQLSIKETPSCEHIIVYRSEMGQDYTIKETPCWDCLTRCFSECCALCQEYRELHTRGLFMLAGNRMDNPNDHLVAPVVEKETRREAKLY